MQLFQVLQPALEECLRRFDWKPWNVRSAEEERDLEDLKHYLLCVVLFVDERLHHRVLYGTLFQGSCHRGSQGCVTSGGAYIIRVGLQIKREDQLLNSY